MSILEANFEIKTFWMLTHFLAHKIVNFVLLNDSFTVSFFNIIENLILNENTANTKQPYGRGPGKWVGFSRNEPQVNSKTSHVTNPLLMDKISCSRSLALVTCEIPCWPWPYTVDDFRYVRRRCKFIWGHWLKPQKVIFPIEQESQIFRPN